MKKLYVIIISFILLWACAPAQETSTKKRFISGTAAVGAYIPDGSQVELRAAPVKTGNQIIVGYYPNGDPDYQDETTPTEVRTAVVSGGEGAYTVDVTGLTEPYIVRVQCGGRWYYSYADGSSDTANVNPYSDWMVRYYYQYINIDPDKYFISGKYDTDDISYTKWSYGLNKTGRLWHNQSMPLPDNVQIQRVVKQLQLIFLTRYSIDIGDVLTREWVVGETYDTILDGTIIDWEYIKRYLAWSYNADDMLESGIAYYYNTDQLYFEFWSPYQYCQIRSVPGIADLTPIDYTDGLYHYKYDGSSGGQNYIDVVIMMSDQPITSPNPGCTYGLTTYIKI